MQVLITVQDDMPGAPPSAGGGDALLDARLDPRFGRAQGYLLCDTATGAVRRLDTASNMSLAQGAGIQAAQAAADAGAEAVITGHVGPKAYTALRRGGIAVYLSSHATVRQALRALADGGLAPATEPDREGHW
ncbi:NifB/NifX family molybdenum-iron cluster-binding protein [Nitratidesulfovibrio sp. 1201_IL3209]|uniref:NifB/NifX family molybdenum-iron cluster-binding protein n=1 Tax=Nitratidesulfovibrio sp. 1201_IL3209 TaxID=3084053 RepID=UPI002FDB8038